MKIFKYNDQGGIDHDESQLTRLSATVSDGLATIHRRIYFVAEHPNEDAIDILSLKEFPAKYSVHPRHPAFKYYGNAEIAPLSDRSNVWMADLEYATTDPNATDSSAVMPSRLYCVSFAQFSGSLPSVPASGDSVQS